MSKLHEILAVESAKEATAKKLMKESMHTLDKETLFSGITRRLEMFREEDQKSETTETQELSTTVDENLKYLVEPISDWLDVTLIKDKTNAIASAPLSVDGVILHENIPATFLLGLEKKLVLIRELYEKIPTLPPGIKWIPDVNRGDNVFVSAQDTIQMKTRKDPEFRVVYEATQEHPAQIQQVDRVQDIGKYITTTYSGKMAPIEKAKRIARIDKLINAVKTARQKANNVDIISDSIGESIMNYINLG